MANWIAREFDWTLGRYTGNYYNIAQAGVVAVFVDSHFGLDTNAGTAIAPFRTLTRAINHLNTNGANGSRIFMNGIFSENLPTQTFWYEFIGCGGGANGRTIFFCNVSLSLVPRLRNNSRYHNIRTLGYIHSNTVTTFQLTEFNQYNYFIVNSLIANCDCGHQNVAENFNINVFHTVFFRMRYRGATYWFPSFRILGSNNVFYECWEATTGQNIELLSFNQVVLNVEPSSGEEGTGFFRASENLANNSVHSIIGGNPQFINALNFDFNVRITSPLLGAGLADPITGIPSNIGGVQVGLPYNGLNAEFTTAGGATITNLTVDANGRYTLTPPNRTGTLVSGAMDLGALYPIENIDLFNVFDFLSGQITQGVFETFVSPKMSLTIRIRYGNTVAELDACPWLLIEYGKQPTFSGTGASRVGNADDAFDPNTFQTIICRYMKLFVTLQNNS